MSILNYFFIGAAFTFLIDLLLGMKIMKKHPLISKALKQGGWGMKERLICIIIWPLGALVFLISFIKSYFRK